ncbi:hypothetical protein D3C80_1887750 [compost metagenome]
MQLVFVQDGKKDLAGIRSENLTDKAVGKKRPQAKRTAFQQRQCQQHEKHHLQAADQLVNTAFHLFIDLLLLQTGKQ